MAHSAPASPIPAPSASAAASDTVELRRLIAFLSMVFGMFMAILDIQIV